MQVKTKGLVLREVKTGESDKILSVLTPEYGIISASAKGSLRPKNKLFSGCSLFCYSEFTLFEGRTMYSVNEAAPIEVFFDVRQNVESVALAVYMAELVQILTPTGEEAKRLLQLLLNSLYMLCKGAAAPFVKPVFELRAMSESGFMPDVLACDECGRYDGVWFRLGPHHGTLLCSACAEKKGREVNLDPSALAALRHVVLSDANKVYAFALKGNSQGLLMQAAEEFVLCHLDYPPKSLDFLKNMLLPL